MAQRLRGYTAPVEDLSSVSSMHINIQHLNWSQVIFLIIVWIEDCVLSWLMLIVRKRQNKAVCVNQEGFWEMNKLFWPVDLDIRLEINLKPHIQENKPYFLHCTFFCFKDQILAAKPMEFTIFRHGHRRQCYGKTLLNLSKYFFVVVAPQIEINLGWIWRFSCGRHKWQTVLSHR